MAGVTFTANGAQHELRLGTRACRAIERETGKSMPRLIVAISGRRADDGAVLEEGDLSFDLLHTFFLHGLNGGKGADTPDAVDDVIDDLGFVKAAEMLGEGISAAFPAPEGSDKGEAPASGNGRSKPKAA